MSISKSDQIKDAFSEFIKRTTTEPNVLVLGMDFYYSLRKENPFVFRHPDTPLVGDSQPEHFMGMRIITTPFGGEMFVAYKTP